MSKKAVLYARVSLEIQTKNDAVSIDQQIQQMRQYCQQNNLEIVGEFIDFENYRATQQPNKGMIVNPSGERSDRPQFLKMLDLIKTGDIDAVLCWRDDRLVRHPRVAVALEDALDIGDAKRNGRGVTRIVDATGSNIDRFTLSIKATIWREENKRRAERSMMGKYGSLKDGRWPGEYRRYGYKSVKIPGKRGRSIELDPETAPVVKTIFTLYDSGVKVANIRKELIRNNVPQIYLSLCKHDWSKALILQILRSEEYQGQAKWRFSDGQIITVEIPRIIEPDLFTRVQKRIDSNKTLSTRNAKGVYLLQGLIFCGDCGRQMTVARARDYSGGYSYRCHVASNYSNEGHPKPSCHNGSKLDWSVWRELVNKALRNPHIIREQLEKKISELRANESDAYEQMEKVQSQIVSIVSERAFYQKKTAQGKMTEAEFDRRMDETEEELQYWNSELENLRIVMAETSRVQTSLDFAEAIFTKYQSRLNDIDCDYQTFIALPNDRQDEILKERQLIIRTLVDRITINSERNVIIEGVIDGSESSQFESGLC